MKNLETEEKVWMTLRKLLGTIGTVSLYELYIACMMYMVPISNTLLDMLEIALITSIVVVLTVKTISSKLKQDKDTSYLLTIALYAVTIIYTLITAQSVGFKAIEVAVLAVKQLAIATVCIPLWVEISALAHEQGYIKNVNTVGIQRFEKVGNLIINKINK